MSLVLMLLLVLMLALYLSYSEEVFMIFYSFFEFQNSDISINLIFDSFSVMFIMTIMIIYNSVYTYSTEYMVYSYKKKTFFLNMNLFVFSMIMFIMSGNLITMFFFWEMLGITSFFLVKFYDNSAAASAAALTFFNNRIGDVCFLLSLIIVFSSGITSLKSGNFYPKTNFSLFLVILAAMTKSAQFPFSSWLPAAMAAPTPISSLVHSSTLVAAGVFLLTRYSGLLNSSYLLSSLLLISSSTTMLMAGLAAMIETDFKKIIALSTLSQISLMMIMISISFPFLAYFHMIMHAFFKAGMFMCVGVLIHKAKSNQDIRLISGLSNNSSMYINISMLIMLLSLCGTPFFSGYYSKEMILEVLYVTNNNLLLLLMLVMSTVFTFLYSFRIIFYTMVIFKKKDFFFLSKGPLIMEKTVFKLTMMSIIIGSFYYWVFIQTPLLVFFVKNTYKCMLLFYFLVSYLMFYFFKKKTFLFFFLKNLFFLSSMNNLLYFFFLKKMQMYPKFEQTIFVDLNLNILNWGFFLKKTILFLKTPLLICVMVGMFIY